MKTFFKIALIAAITVFAVLSCEPAITGPHNEYWPQYNEQFDSAGYTNRTYNGTFTAAGSSINSAGVPVTNLSIGDKAENKVTLTITITSPTNTTADVFMADNPEAKLKEFLFFYTYNPDEFTGTDSTGKVHTLVPFTGTWSLEKRVNGNAFLLNIDYVFTASSSNLVWKIDSSRFTYSGGNKMDRDGNGIPGEPVDDFYGTITVNGITNNTTPILPRTGTNAVFTVTLNPSAPSFTWDKATDTTTQPFDIPILAANSFTADFMTQDDKDDFLKWLIPFIKVEKFTDSDWAPTDITPRFDDTNAANHSLMIKALKADHMTAYRIVFDKGTSKLETEKLFLGVNQRFKVTLNGTTVSDYKTDKSRAESDGFLVNNPAIRNIIPLTGNYTDNSGEFNTNTTYTWIYKYTFTNWSPGWALKKVDNPHKDENFEVDFQYSGKGGSGTNYSAGAKDNDAQIYIDDLRLLYDSTLVEAGNNNGFSGTPTSDYIPKDDPSIANPPVEPVVGIPDITVTYPGNNTSEVAPAPSLNPSQLPADTKTPGTLHASGLWEWQTSTALYSNTSTYETKTDHIPITVNRPRSVLTRNSYDSQEQNNVLKLEIGPNSVHDELKGVTTRYYAKELSLKDFKDNFKIYYIRTNDAIFETNKGVGGETLISNKAIEIDIVKVEYKQEKISGTSPTDSSKTYSDKFIESNLVKYVGYNVIYITLDPNYKHNTYQKALYVGDGFGLSDNITVLGGNRIWVNNGFKAYRLNATSYAISDAP